MKRLKSKLPARQELLPVFSVILFIDFSWMFYRMFWQVPSWLYYLEFSNILVIAAYALSFALIESGLVLGLFIVLSVILPARYFRDQFVAQGSALALVMGISAWALQRKIGLLEKLELEQLIIYPILVLVFLLVFVFILSFVFDHLKIIQGWMVAFAERMTVFGYIYVPLSLIGLVVVLLRNIF